MNKLFSKIATLSVGLALAIGVGVAVGSKGVREARADGTANFTLSSASSVTVDGVTAAFDKNTGGTAPTWYPAGLRLYAKNTVTISSSNAITAISFNWEKQGNKDFATVSADAGNYTHPSNTGTGSWSGNANQVVFTLGSTGQLQLNTFNVTYSGGQSVSYTITYDKNGGTGTMSSTTNTVAECGFTAPSGKTFSKWNTAANGSGTDYAPGATASSDLDLFAIWEDIPTALLFEGVGAGFPAAVSESVDTTEIIETYSANEYTFNYLQCKKQNSSAPYAIFMTKNVDAFVSNHTEVPGSITSVELFANSGASGSATYDVAFGTTEFTTATAGIGAVNITGGNSHTYTSNVSDAKFFCITLGAAYNGQLIKIVVNYESTDPSKKDMVIYQGDNPADSGSFLWSNTQGIYSFTAKEESTSVTAVSWSVSDSEVATINASTGALTCVKPGSVTIYAEADGYNKASATIEIIKGTLEEISVSGFMTKTSYTTIESWSPAGLAVTATYHSGWEEAVTTGLTWTYEPTQPAENVTSVVATAHLEEESASSAAQTVTVTVMHAGTFADPYTVDNARAAVDAGSGVTGVYAIGIVSEIVTEYNPEYENITFNISSDGLTTSNQLQAFRCKGSTAHPISSNADIEVGATVIVKGNLKNYHGTYEFDANCTVESYTAPEKGDIEVTFAPTTSYEIGASGTFTASTDPAGATLAWESNDPSVLSVNASTGAFEALSVGVARVTVNATLNDQHGTAFADIVVNGSQTSPYSVNDVLTNIAPSLDGTTSYYIYVSAYVKEFATSMSTGSKPRAIDVIDFDEQSRMMVYTNVDPYEGFVDGLSLGDYILVKAKVQKFVSGNSVSYQLTQPEKIESHTSAMAFAFKLLEETDGKCSTYVDGKSSYSEFKTYFEGIWDDVENAYNALENYDGEQDKVLGAIGNEDGTVLEQAMARYDLLVAKYGLTHFVTSRAKISYRGFSELNILNADSNMIIIVAVASMSALALAMLLVFKKKKQK